MSRKGTQRSCKTLTCGQNSIVTWYALIWGIVTKKCYTDGGGVMAQHSIFKQQREEGLKIQMLRVKIATRDG